MPAKAAAQQTVTDSTLQASLDSVEFSLLTCQPHDEIYSLYGHTALRYRDLQKKEDWAINYGVFNFHAPYFTLRFIFGLTDYWVEAYPIHRFYAEYQSYGSQVTEQVLNLTAMEKLTLLHALGENIRPENRVYRYNYFYDNCTTRARDMVERCVHGVVQYEERTDEQKTYRDLVHACTEGHPWAAFGNDLLLGVKSDLPTDLRQQEFLPANLMNDFEHAYILDTDGNRRPLVKDTRTLVPAGKQTAQSGFPLSPMWCGVILLLVSLAVLAVEWKRGKSFVWWDIVLMAAQGLTGVLLTVMVFSQHPTTSLNLQLLLFNPLPLLFINKVYRRKPTHYWNLLPVMTLLFYIGGIWQDYAEGMEIVALCLLLRYWIHTKDVPSKAVKPVKQKKTSHAK
ncbi:MAG: DUF4105 domain-containing protein [Prevotella sp.]|nr:DUF4105 domain-containing protein [Prevotella sp.]